MSILVTGGAGYIGSILVPILLQKSYKVIVLDNFIYNQTSLLDCCYYKNFEIIRGDVRDEKLLKNLLKKVDVIFPLACITGAPACDKNPYEAKSVNLDSIKLLLKNRSKNQIIIFPTTNSGYGIGQEGIYCTEETPLRPISLYGKLKVEAEKGVLDSGNSITLRFATCFGISPRMRLDLLVNDFVYRAVTDGYVIVYQGHFKRNYIHVRDASSAFIHCLENFDKMKDNAYNVGLSEANISKIELCEIIKKHIPNFYYHEAGVGEDPDKRNYIVSNEKIEKTGFKAKISLDEGIEELIKGYKIIRKFGFSNT
ncbi:MAG: NAD(P)-dependent oxidoreductase [Candidatus Omnitrophica bacterium]|nr:NAD(P)-dependent oxidoreductase [Candidatus Omnitrophota bacterium]